MPSFDTTISLLPPLAVTVPIVVACLLLAMHRLLPRWVLDGVSFATAMAVAGMVATVLVRASEGRVVTWSAKWEPKHGFSVGIAMVSDPVGAGIALLACVLVALALLYSWRYFQDADAHYHCLVLLFLAGMVGFAMTGDLFDMFVFFELMGAAAYALTGFKVEDPTAVEGALNFGIINSLGAYVTLMGVGMLYARTGDLGLPQLAHALAGHKPDALLVAAFVAILTGFLVKGAMAPFHFWLADAHAVAPSPVCVLFSGVMVPLGVYGAFRVYWTVFDRVLPMGDVRRTFLVMGLVTAVVGAGMCFAQRHIKRLLAYSTIAHVGLFLVAAGCLTQEGTAGAIVYVLGHAGVKAALFLLAGALLNRYGSVDENDLWGRGRNARVMPWLFVAGGLALAGLPPFGTGLGKAIGEEAGLRGGYGWVPVLFILVSAVTGGAVLRVCGRVYFGLGDPPSPKQGGGPETSGKEEPDVTSPLAQVRLTMLVPIVVLLLGALAIGVIPGLTDTIGHAAAVFIDPAGYAHEALTGSAAPVHVEPSSWWTVSGVLLGVFSTALAAVFAGIAIYGKRVRQLADAGKRAAPAITVVRRIHSGHIGDYVAWFMTGIAVLGGLVGLPLR